MHLKKKKKMMMEENFFRFRFIMKIIYILSGLIFTTLVVQVNGNSNHPTRISRDLHLNTNPLVRICNRGPCSPRWTSDQWSECTVPCGGGYQYRDVFCAEYAFNGSLVRLSQHLCSKQKPTTKRSCNTHECHQWFEGPWSECSVSCGTGHRTRSVTCIDGDGEKSFLCNNSTKPSDRQTCILLPCSTSESSSNSLMSERMEDDEPLMNSQPYQSSSWSKEFPQPKFFVGNWGPCTGVCGNGKRYRQVECRILMHFSKSESIVPDSECGHHKPHNEESCKLPNCDLNVAPNQITENSVKLPKSLESAALALKADIKKSTFSWQTSGFTECSAQCLGGTQESIIQCRRDSDGMIASHYLCNIQEKPDSITRTCNEHPCPPRWELTDFTECSKPCGGGFQTRKVHCIHEIALGAENTIKVPNYQCSEPKPLEERSCNDFDCPTESIIKPKSDPKNSCNSAQCLLQENDVNNNKKDDHHHLQKEKDDDKQLKTSKCLTSSPNDLQSLNCPNLNNDNNPSHTKSSFQETPFSSDLDKQLVKHKSKGHKCPKKACKTRSIKDYSSNRKVILKVGGNAIIYKGDYLKIRCPRPKLSTGLMPKVDWYKNSIKIFSNDKYTITKKGALIIRNVTVKDAAIFTCIFGTIRQTLSVNVEPRQLKVNTDTINNNLDLMDKQELPAKWLNNKKDVNSIDETINLDKKVSNIMDNYPIKSDHKPSFSGNQEQTNYLPSHSHSFGDAKLSIINGKNNWNFNSDHDKFAPRSGASSNHQDPFSKVTNFFRQNLWKQSPTIDSASNSNEINPSSINSVYNDINKIHHKRAYYLSSELDYNLTLYWMTSDWSNCSEICGGEGFQIRARQCVVQLNNITRPSSDETCINNGKYPPSTIKNCGSSQCPKWNTSEWSECKNCRQIGEGEKYRQVNCVHLNGSKVSDSMCPSKRPENITKCLNPDCKPVWKSYEWSNCLCLLNGTSIQYRLVNCVWLANGLRSTASECHQSSTPPPNKQECFTNCDGCKDEHLLCSLAKDLNACKNDIFRQNCCRSCSHLQIVTNLGDNLMQTTVHDVG